MPLCVGNDVFKNLALCATQWCFSFYESVRRTGWNSIIRVSGKLHGSTQCNTVQLVSACHGKLRDSPHFSWAFVADQPRSAVLRDLVLVDQFAVSGYDEGDHALASTSRIWRSDNSGHSNLGVCVKDLFDLSGEHVEAVNEHNILLAVGYKHKAVFVEIANVTRVDEAVADGLRGLFGLVAVARHHVRTSDAKLAPFTRWQHL